MELAMVEAVPNRNKEPREARIATLVDAHLDAVWRTLKRLGVPPASIDDATQQVFVVVSRRLDDIEVGREKAYMMGVALKVASDARRSWRRRREVSLEETPMSESPEVGDKNPHEVLAQKQTREILGQALEDMPDDLREAFVLFEIDELSGPRVAELLGIPLGTVASRVRRAREHLRQKLSGGSTP